MAENKPAATPAAPPSAAQSEPPRVAPRTSDVSHRVGDEPVVEVEFLRTVQFESEGRNEGPVFEKGERRKFGAAFAQRWIRRNAAFDTAGQRPRQPAKPEPARNVRGGASGDGLG